MDNCTSEWTILNGVEGRKFTSKKNGNSIFLPAAGYRLYGYFDDVGSRGLYWSSSLGTGDPNFASGFGFRSGGVYTGYYIRDGGQSVRPVYVDRVNVTGVSLNKTGLSLEIGATSTLSATVAPSNAAERSVIWSSSNSSVATVDASGKVTAVKAGNATITVTTIDGGYTATCSVTVVDPEAVDLGLPSGLKWASCNLGATKPEEYGGYYQWGGLQDVTDTSICLDWSNCPYCTGTGCTKYIPSDKSSYWSGTCSPDNKTVLDPEDDIAHVTLGGKWRMPTEDEFEELMDNCISEWTTLNGVKGRKFTSKKNGSSIFLPAAGWRYYDCLDNVGSIGSYWSSSLGTGYPSNAYGFDFYSDYVDTNYGGRYNGQPVRPVYGDRVNVTGVSLNKTGLSLEIGATSTLSATVAPSNAAERSVNWSSSNPSVATVDANGKVTAVKAGSATITVTTTDGGYAATCSVTVVDPEAVDLGLPSGLKWASFNLGATKPEEYGGYYQWAGLQDVTDTSIYLDYSNCPYHTGSSYSTGWTKYIPSDKSSYWSGSGSPDNKTILDLEDDIAHVALGGKWRMPTIYEFNELIDNCTSEWTTLNGVNGRKFTSKKNGNIIFLPAAGYRSYDCLIDVGSFGYYWSSSLNAGGPYRAYQFPFSSGLVIADGYRRYSGRPVRPVSE